jgi:hypothetical protein
MVVLSGSQWFSYDQLVRYCDAPCSQWSRDIFWDPLNENQHFTSVARGHNRNRTETNMGKPTGKHISKLPSGNQTWLAGTFRSMTFDDSPIKTSIYRVSSLPCLIIKGYHSGASNNMPEQGASHLINKGPWVYHSYSSWPFGAMTNSQASCHHYPCTRFSEAEATTPKEQWPKNVVIVVVVSWRFWYVLISLQFTWFTLIMGKLSRITLW